MLFCFPDRNTSDLDRTRRNTHSRRIVFKRFQEYGICRNLTVVSNLKCSKNLCSRSHCDVISKGRMTLALVQTNTTEGYSLIDRAVISNLCRLSDHDPATVINQDSMSELCSRMDLNQRKETRNLRNHSRDEKHVVLIKPMRKSMPDQSMNTLIQNQNLQRIACRRISLLNCLHILPDIF